jgi:class 3 adenylate cyclase
MSFLKDQFHNLIVKQGLKAGIHPVKDLEGEPDRLEEINRLDLIDKDVTNDRHLNNVTELACYLTNRPQCTINLLTDKSQLSKNNHGFNIPDKIMIKEIPRDISLCQYVLELPKEQLIIENVKEHARTKNFQKMPMAPDIQFYAGTPIITSRGFTVGTLCIMDNKPGKMDHNQRQGLRLLSDQVSNILELNPDATDTESSKIKEKTTPNMEGAYYSSATILFTDFVGFTQITETIEPGELIETLDEFFTSFDQIIKNHNLRKVKTIGDSYMAVGGVPEGRKGHPVDACKAGLDIIKIVDALNLKRKILGQLTWDIRIGIHTGPIIAGFSNGGFDIWGDAVNTAARLESASEANKVQISDETRQFIEKAADITDRGFIELKNKGKMQTFFLNSLD